MSKNSEIPNDSLLDALDDLSSKLRQMLAESEAIRNGSLTFAEAIEKELSETSQDT